MLQRRLYPDMQSTGGERKRKFRKLTSLCKMQRPSGREAWSFSTMSGWELDTGSESKEAGWAGS